MLTSWRQLLCCALLFWSNLLLASAEERLRAQINTLGSQVSAADFEQIWRQVQALPSTELIRLSRAEDNNYFEQGWFELAQQYRLAEPRAQSQSLAAWKADWFHHPAVAWLDRLNTPASTQQPVAYQVQRMGVLLPLSGRFEVQGREVLMGIKTAISWDLQRGFPVPELQVFDSHDLSDPGAFIEQVGLGQGLDLVLGPLQLEQTTQLDKKLGVPVLALNRTGGAGFNGYQLDLASDQELRQLVQLMQREGRKRVLVLAPADESWVEPMMLWLEQQMRLAGLKTQGILRYGRKISQLEQQLGQWLGVAASQQRAGRLASLLGQELSFSPRRRQDLDAIVLIARPEQARLIKPMIDYQQASDLPIYASSHLYSGTPDAKLDADLNSVRFCDMPWRLRLRDGPESPSMFFALGMDAGSVHRALPQMQAGVSGYFEGETGNLRLPKGQRMERTLLCARFERGVPRPYVWGDGSLVE